MHMYIAICAMALAGCFGARAATYESELVLCNQQAPTLRASIECENDVRARYRRPPRPLNDGGTP